MSACRNCLAFFVVFAYLALRVTSLHAQSETIQLWLIHYANQGDLNRLAGDLDVWEVDHDAQTLLAPLTSEEAEQLSQTHTLTVAPDQSPLHPPQVSAAQVNGIPGFECYRTVDESFAALDQLALDYPQMVTKVDIGDSWDKVTAGGPAGDDMRVLVVTNKAVKGPKFHFMLMGAIHAREYVTAELALRFAELLLQRYRSDADATWLLDHGELDLLTFANPDGRRIAETGQLWRKNTHFDPTCSVSLPSRSYGIDLNRNSTFMWNGCEGFSCSSASSCAETYRGAAPGSEPEVQSIEAYIRSIFPDQRADSLQESAPLTKAGLFLSLHSYGQLVLFPWGWTTSHAPNGLGLATIARHFGYPLDYEVCQAGGDGCLYQTDGTTDDFAYGALGVPSFTIEFGNSFFQACSTFENSMVEPSLDAFLYAFKAAPRAYLLAQGPDVVGLSVTPQNLGVERMVTISATADAGRVAPLSGFDTAAIDEPVEPIQSVRLTIDQLPWDGAPVAYPMAALDGAFDTVQEAISTTLEISCFPSGRHTLYLQAQDSGEDWGVLSAKFVTVTNNSTFTTTISSDQATVRDGETVSYTVNLTNTGVATATFTVEFTNLDESVNTDVNVISPSHPITLSAGASTHLIVAITPHNSAAGTIVPAVIVVRSVDDPTQCRQVQMATPVEVWNYRQRMILIGKP